MKKNFWWKIRNQSLAVYARDAGFDLAIYNEYSVEVREQLKKRSKNKALWGIRESFEEAAEFEISKVKKGIYVISVSHPLCIQYKTGRSEVIYIGLGNIENRISIHFDESLFDFMQSLSGANFDFMFSVPAKKNAAKYYKHVEYEMLKYFHKKYGSYPVLNSNAGADQGLARPGTWWNKPLKATGKKPRWALSPTSHSDFVQLD